MDKLKREQAVFAFPWPVLFWSHGLVCLFQDAISRLQTLLDEGQLEGMMDDRGKFIYLTTDELEAVAKYIRQNGRVAISDLSEASTSLVNLESSLSSRETSVAA